VVRSIHIFTGHSNHRILCWSSSNQGSRNPRPDYRQISRAIPYETQTTPMILPPQVSPNPKSPAEVVYGVASLYCRGMNRYRPLPHLSKNPDLHLVPEMWMKNLRPLSKVGEAMENDDGNLDQ